MSAAPDWKPFLVCSSSEASDPMRSAATLEGVTDRLRVAAFAELQAREAFRWACGALPDAPGGLRSCWAGLVGEEDRHLGWLMGRLSALGSAPGARTVSARLWDSLTACRTAEEFEILVAKAEERGRQAGERFRTLLAPVDPESAAVFGRIADEEVSHVALARRHFPESAAAAGLP